MSDAERSWDLVADSVHENDLVSSVLALSKNTGADVTVSIRVDGSDRYLSISTGRAPADDEVPAE